MSVTVTVGQGRGGNTHSALPAHVDWIASYVQGVDADPHYAGDNWTLASKLRGHCHSACIEMLQAFPDLILVRGWTVSPEYADVAAENIEELDPGDGHYWLETADGQIVDPTAQQFRSTNPHYVAFDESKAHTLPTGKCPNCGDYCYNNTDCCTDECFKSYCAYMGIQVGS